MDLLVHLVLQAQLETLDRQETVDDLAVSDLSVIKDQKEHQALLELLELLDHKDHLAIVEHLALATIVQPLVWRLAIKRIVFSAEKGCCWTRFHF